MNVTATGLKTLDASRDERVGWYQRSKFKTQSFKATQALDIFN